MRPGMPQYKTPNLLQRLLCFGSKTQKLFSHWTEQWRCSCVHVTRCSQSFEPRSSCSISLPLLCMCFSHLTSSLGNFSQVAKGPWWFLYILASRRRRRKPQSQDSKQKSWDWPWLDTVNHMPTPEPMTLAWEWNGLIGLSQPRVKVEIVSLQHTWVMM